MVKYSMTENIKFNLTYHLQQTVHPSLCWVPLSRIEESPGYHHLGAGPNVTSICEIFQAYSAYI